MQHPTHILRSDAWPPIREARGFPDQAASILDMLGRDPAEMVVDGPLPGSRALSMLGRFTRNSTRNANVVNDTAGWTGITRVSSVGIGLTDAQRNGPMVARVDITGPGIHEATFTIDAPVGVTMTVSVSIRNAGPGTIRRRLKQGASYFGANTVVNAGANSTTSGPVIPDANPGTITVELSQGTAGGVVYIYAAVTRPTSDVIPSTSAPNLNDATGEIIPPWEWTGAPHASTAILPGERAQDETLLNTDLRRPYTLMGRVAFDDRSANHGIFWYFWDGYAEVYYHTFGPDIEFGRTSSYSASQTYTRIPADPAILAAEWWNIAATWDPATARSILTINGIEVLNEVLNLPAVHQVGEYFSVIPRGSNQGASRFAGSVFYDGVVLTPEEQAEVFAIPDWTWATLNPDLGGIAVSIPAEPVTIVVTSPDDPVEIVASASDDPVMVSESTPEEPIAVEATPPVTEPVQVSVSTPDEPIGISVTNPEGE